MRLECLYLDDVMGAKGHMAGFSADGQQFIHAHPLNTSDPSLLKFHIQPQNKGMTRFFLQVQHDGEEMYLSFSRIVKTVQKTAEQMREPVPHEMVISR